MRNTVEFPNRVFSGANMRYPSLFYTHPSFKTFYTGWAVTLMPWLAAQQSGGEPDVLELFKLVENEFVRGITANNLDKSSDVSAVCSYVTFGAITLLEFLINKQYTPETIKKAEFFADQGRLDILYEMVADKFRDYCNEHLAHVLPPAALDVVFVELSEMYGLACHGYVYSATGSRDYTVSPALSLCFEHTSLNKYPSARLRTPYPSICVQLPPSLIGPGVQDAWAYVMEHYTDKAHHIQLCLRQVTEEGELQLSHVPFFLGESSTVSEVVAKNRPRIVGSGFTKKDYDVVVKVFLYVANVLIYATNSETSVNYRTINESLEYTKTRQRALRHPKGSNKRAKALANAKRLRGKDVIQLTGDIMVDRFAQGLTRDGQEAQTGTRGKMKTRFMVGGHHHHYWVGAKGTPERRLVEKFLAPYWKGPKIGVVSNRSYKLK